MLGPIGGLIGLYLGGLILRWTGSWLGGRATAQQVRAAIAWSSVPSVATLAIWIPELVLFGSDMFTSRTPRIEANPSLGMLLLALSGVEIVLAIWQFVLFLKCVGEVHGFSAWRALGASLLPIVVLLPLLILIVVVVIFVGMALK
jgi:hypothetical protein